MATTKQRLKVSFLLTSLVFVNLIYSTSARDGLLSRLYKKAASKNRPLVLVIDNPDSKGKYNDRTYSAENGGRGKSLLPYLLLQKQDQSYENLNYKRPVNQKYQTKKSRNYRNRYSDRRERNRYDGYNGDRQLYRYDRDEDRTEEYLYDKYRNKNRNREEYNDRRERNNYRPRSNGYSFFNGKLRLRTKDNNLDRTQDINPKGLQSQDKNNQQENRQDQDRREQYRNRYSQERSNREDQDRRDRQDEDRRYRQDEDRRDRQDEDRRNRENQDRRDKQYQDRHDRHDQDRRDRFDQDRRDRVNQDRRDRQYAYDNRAISGKVDSDDTSGARAQIPVVKKLLRSLNCAARDECEDTCGESYKGPKKDECQNECDQQYECEEEDDYVDPCQECGDAGRGCGEDTCSGSTKGTVLSNEDTGCKRC